MRLDLLGLSALLWLVLCSACKFYLAKKSRGSSARREVSHMEVRGAERLEILLRMQPFSLRE